MVTPPVVTSISPRRLPSWTVSCFLLLAVASAPVAQAQATATASIQVPLHADVPSFTATAESSIPRELAADGAWTMVDNDNWGIKYHVWRGPLGVQVQGNRVSVSANLSYAAAVCKREKKPWPLSGYVCPQVASCGYDQLITAQARQPSTSASAPTGR